MAKKQKVEKQKVPTLFSCVDVAKAWVCSPETVRKKTKSLELPHRKATDGSIYFDAIPEQPGLRVYNRN